MLVRSLPRDDADGRLYSNHCMNLHVITDPSDPRALWPYNPSFGAAIFFSILFAAVTIAHVVEWFVFKKVGYIEFSIRSIAYISLNDHQRFSWVIVMSAGWQFAGFGRYFIEF
jgi:hypothetical protein